MWDRKTIHRSFTTSALCIKSVTTRKWTLCNHHLSSIQLPQLHWLTHLHFVLCPDTRLWLCHWWWAVLAKVWWPLVPLFLVVEQEEVLLHCWSQVSGHRLTAQPATRVIRCVSNCEPHPTGNNNNKYNCRLSAYLQPLRCPDVLSL